MTLVKWSPVRDLGNIEKEFDSLFRSFRNRFESTEENDSNKELDNAVWMPLTDIAENDDNYILRLDLPGIEKNDVKISYSDGELSISGERRQEKESKDSKYHRIERSYGKYYRSFTLPEKINADKIDAEFNNGQLTITVPKSEETKPKEIEVKVK